MIGEEHLHLPEKAGTAEKSYAQMFRNSPRGGLMQEKHRRRPHYSGKYPRRFEEKYKEKNPEKYKIVNKVEIYTYLQESTMLLTIAAFLIFGKI